MTFPRNEWQTGISIVTKRYFTASSAVKRPKLQATSSPAG